MGISKNIGWQSNFKLQSWKIRSLPCNENVDLSECKCNGEGHMEGNICRQDTGLCTGSCKPGFYGDTCYQSK